MGTRIDADKEVFDGPSTGLYIHVDLTMRQAAGADTAKRDRGAGPVN